MSPAGAPAQVCHASAPGRLELSGRGDGPRLSVALDRRATCRVEAIPGGVEVESKESLTKASARDVGELAGALASARSRPRRWRCSGRARAFAW